MTSALLSHFPVPALSSQGDHRAFRRSWFREQLRGAVGVMRLLALLGNLNPARLAALPRRDIRTVYLALLQEMETRFPIQDYVFMQAEIEWEEEEIPYAAERIPVAAQGLNPWEEQVDAPFAIAYALSRPVDYDDFEDQESLAPHRAWLNDMVSWLQARNVSVQHVRRPRGRAWRREWAALPDLFNFCNSSTGHPLLDYDYYSLIENGDQSFPELNLAEIRWLENDWRASKVILDRIMKLVRYLERGKTRRLQLFANALLGTPDALREITEPLPAHHGTLAQVFART